MIRIRMRVTAGHGGQFFWTTQASPRFSEDRTVPFAIQPDGQLHEYRLEPGRDAAWAGQMIAAIRIDPGNAATSGEFSVDYVRGPAEWLLVTRGGTDIISMRRNVAEGQGCWKELSSLSM